MSRTLNIIESLFLCLNTYNWILTWNPFESILSRFWLMDDVKVKSQLWSVDSAVMLEVNAVSSKVIIGREWSNVVCPVFSESMPDLINCTNIANSDANLLESIELIAVADIEFCLSIILSISIS